MLGTIIFAVIGFAIYVVMDAYVKSADLTAWKKFKVCSLVGVAYFSVLFLVSPWDNKKELTEEELAKNIEEEQSDKAYYDCGRFVRDNVKLPDSLDWQYSNSTRGKNKDGDYLIAREFIAENSFGGRVRNRALCIHDGAKLLEAAIVDI